MASSLVINQLECDVDEDCNENFIGDHSLSSSQRGICDHTEVTKCPGQCDETGDECEPGCVIGCPKAIKLKSPLPNQARRKWKNKKKKPVGSKDPVAVANHQSIHHIPQLCEHFTKKSKLSSDVVLVIGQRADGSTALIKQSDGHYVDEDSIRAVAEVLSSKFAVKCSTKKLVMDENNYQNQHSTAQADLQVLNERAPGLPVAQKPGAMSIDECVDKVFQHIKDKDYGKLNMICDKLEKLKYFTAIKHKINYWRVMQCVGEVAVDTLVSGIINIQKDSYKSPVYHNLCFLVRMFMGSLCNIGIIKRVNLFHDKLGLILLKALRQTVNSALVVYAFQTIHRCLIVGKNDTVEFYVKGGLLQDIYKHIKHMVDEECFGQGGIHGVSFSCKMLLTISICGSDQSRKWVRHSKALQILKEFIDKLSSLGECEHQIKMLNGMYCKLMEVVTDEKAAKMNLLVWNCKEILQAELEQEQAFAFCSTPNCLKLCTPTEKFRYCGACRLARYCSESCQKAHWKYGHKEACLRDPESLEESLLG